MILFCEQLLQIRRLIEPKDGLERIGPKQIAVEQRRYVRVGIVAERGGEKTIAMLGVEVRERLEIRVLKRAATRDK